MVSWTLTQIPLNFTTHKFEPSMLVELNDNDELRKMFRFNDIHFQVYLSLNTEDEVSIEVIPKRRFINLHSTFILTL